MSRTRHDDDSSKPENRVRNYSVMLGATTLTAASLLFALGTTSLAPQTTDTPGSPGATAMIDGKYLQPPPPKFGGDINLQASKSKPYWPARMVPPKGAPNVLLIMTDDQGYGVSGTFGGVIPTPAMDRIYRCGKTAGKPACSI
jgi:hypothetical protein